VSGLQSARETQFSGCRVYPGLSSFNRPTALGVVMPITAKYELRHFHPRVIQVEVKKEFCGTSSIV
jgi:hypothetical protein